MNIDVYPSGRGGGKTTWLLDQINQAILDDQSVAVLIPTRSHRINSPGDVYTESTFEHARGRRYDHIFVDNADLFNNAPAELCMRVAPGVPVTMTYSHQQGSSLPMPATPPDLPKLERTSLVPLRWWLARRLAENSGE